MARVSVIIPCYNDGQYLRQSVMSALSQNFTDLEVIIVDDGSTDETTLTELESLSHLPRVTLIQQLNSGPSAARNRGIGASSAEYFMPLDADDMIEPPYIGEGVQVLDEHDTVGAVYCRADLIGDSRGMWNLSDFDWPTMLVHNQVFNACVFRRADWESAGGYDETMRDGREDHDFILKILALGRTVWRLEAVYFHYRRRTGSRNAAIGANRDQLVSASAKIFRNNIGLYAERAEDLFIFIYRQHDEIADLRHRYAVLENMRERFPRASRLMSRATRSPKAFLSLRVRQQKLSMRQPLEP